MKLRDKDCNADLFGYFPNRKGVFMIPSDKILSSHAFNRVPNRPLYLVQYAHFLSDLYAIENDDFEVIDKPEIYCYSDCSVNYRPMLPYTNRTVDLSSVGISDQHDWILPLDPLNDEAKAQFPWNWDWFSDQWWELMLTDNSNMIKQHLKDRKERDLNFTSRHAAEFKEFIGNKYFNGDTSFDLEYLLPPNEKRIEEFYKIAVYKQRPKKQQQQEEVNQQEIKPEN